jgi:uncharacterized integral membrane protein
LTASSRRAYRDPDLTMNSKLLLKTVFLMLVLLLLVLMGMYNRGRVDFLLPPLINKQITLPSALMYFAFFAGGVLTGTILTVGSGSKGKGGKSAK